MIKKLGLAATLSALLLSGCGGGGSDTTVATTTPTTTTATPAVEKLTFTYESVTIDSTSTFGRVSYYKETGTTQIATVSTNKTTTWELSGADDTLFELIDAGNNTKKLSFLAPVDYGDIQDADANNMYEVDIKATDTDGQSVIYQTNYQIIDTIESTTEADINILKNRAAATDTHEIKRGSLRGTSPVENARTVISSSELSGGFYFDIELHEANILSKVFVYFTDDTYNGSGNGIILTLNSTDAVTIKFDCKMLDPLRYSCGAMIGGTDLGQVIIDDRQIGTPIAFEGILNIDIRPDNNSTNFNEWNSLEFPIIIKD